jgi:hypothetical protein
VALVFGIVHARWSGQLYFIDMVLFLRMAALSAHNHSKYTHSLPTTKNKVLPLQQFISREPIGLRGSKTSRNHTSRLRIPSEPSGMGKDNTMQANTVHVPTTNRLPSRTTGKQTTYHCDRDAPKRRGETSLERITREHSSQKRR